MTKFLLSVHVLAAIVAIGPVTVAASMFPAAARRAIADPRDAAAHTTLRTLHRICRVYAAVGIVVPVFGLATATSLGVLTDTWLLVSIALTAIAAALLVLRVLPRQQMLLTGIDAPGTQPEPTATATGAATGAATASTPTTAPQRLAAYTGVFNLLWATVTVLMIVRPGSTTGV
ncbi:hypothetical protein O7621_16555 [Solwaraspora sp. WMMD937]|uniref:hypothetical protein n=1 Tax=Solwaraspora sp. WMMD937 TaxID=3016090 RepID=UPI002499ADB0|nr:hypothetical protein [Solwaraspora sp. WMMD937]WFE19550.1 hypothetical protein O7621_16555 [Solwaraspora sp. WMMD937]